MYFNKSTTPLALLFAAMTLPSVHGAISIGQQFRNGKVNYHVAWQEGLSPCSNDVAFALQSERLCNQNFDIDGTAYYLVGCTDPGNKAYQNPQRLRRVKDNSLYGNCYAAEQKIGCKGDPHDVIKHYVCG